MVPLIGAPLIGAPLLVVSVAGTDDIKENTEAQSPTAVHLFKIAENLIRVEYIF